MKNKLLNCIALGSIGALLAVCLWRAGAPSSAGIPTDAPAPMKTQEIVAGKWDEGIISVRRADFVQTYTVHGDGDFVVVDESLDVSTGTWTTASYVSNVTFDPFVFSSAGRDYFAIGGIDHSTGDTVIERWKLVSKVGVPGSPHTKTFLRMQVYRGNVGQSPVALGVDPDKRFLLYLCDTPTGRQLYQIPMQANAAPVLLYDSIAQPVLSQAWMLNPLEHASLGRIWLVSGMTSDYIGDTMVLVDSANDGAFDPPPIVDSHASLVSSGLLDASQISDPFVGG